MAPAGHAPGAGRREGALGLAGMSVSLGIRTTSGSVGAPSRPSTATKPLPDTQIVLTAVTLVNAVSCTSILSLTEAWRCARYMRNENHAVNVCNLNCVWVGLPAWSSWRISSRT